MIRRRRLVLAAGLITVVLMALGAVGSVLVVTGTETGRSLLQRVAAQQLAPVVKGRLYIGRISGPILTGVTIDSLEIADSSGVVMVSAEKATVAGKAKTAAVTRKNADARVKKFMRRSLRWGV